MNAAVAKLADAANGGGRRAGAREPLKVLGAHPRTEAEIKLMEGRFGPYVTDGTTNATLPKSLAPDQLTLEEAAQLIDERAAKGPAPKKGRGRKAPAKKAPAKKKAAKNDPDRYSYALAAAVQEPPRARARRRPLPIIISAILNRLDPRAGLAAHDQRHALSPASATRPVARIPLRRHCHDPLCRHASSTASSSTAPSTRGEPATFPLPRLIRGWQEGVPMMRRRRPVRIRDPL